MERKLFELGIIIGRFQTLHNGHVDMIEKACKICKKVGVFIFASQEYGTKKDPFTYSFRENMLRSVFGEKISIFPLPESHKSNDSAYIKEKIIKHFGRLPDVVISGKSLRRTDWFGKEDEIAELYLPKETSISATQLRKYLFDGDKMKWCEFVPRELWNQYDIMRMVMLSIKDDIFSNSVER